MSRKRTHSPQINPSLCGEEDLQENTDLLVELVNTFAERLFKNVCLLPLMVRKMLRMVWTVSDSQLRGSGTMMVHSVLFLRFICPALINPVKFGLCRQTMEITPDTQRSLILVLKIIQNISSGVEFDGSKEHFMCALNPLVQTLHVQLRDRLEQTLFSDHVEVQRTKAKHEAQCQGEGEALLVVSELLSKHRKEVFEKCTSGDRSILAALFADLKSDEVPLLRPPRLAQRSL